MLIFVIYVIVIETQHCYFYLCQKYSKIDTVIDYVYTGFNNEDGDRIAIYIVAASIYLIHHSIAFGILEQGLPEDTGKW